MALGLKVLLTFAFALAHISLSACKSTVKGSVSCLDCPANLDLSGIVLAVICSHEKKLMTVTTNEKGYFKAEIHPSSSSGHPNCIVKLLGGPEQLYTYKKSMVSKIAKAEGMDDYKLSTPLTVLSSFPMNKQPEFGRLPEMGSLKTFDLPLPREWGLPPSSYYVPYFPIIGVP